MSGAVQICDIFRECGNTSEIAVAGAAEPVITSADRCRAHPARNLPKCRPRVCPDYSQYPPVRRSGPGAMEGEGLAAFSPVGRTLQAVSV